MKTNRIALALALVAGIGLVGFGASQAQAGHPWGVGLHSGHSSFHIVRGGSIYSSSRYIGPGRLYSGHIHPVHPQHFGGRARWHDTSHFDWHPGSYQFNGYNYQYVPGHWDFHRDGHWDVHRGGHYRH